MAFKDLFVKNDETEATKKPVVKTETKRPTIVTTTPSSVLSVNALPTPVNVTQQEIDEFTQYLMGVYEKGNFPGPDYQEFMSAVNEVSSSDPSLKDATTFKTVFAGFKVQGVKKERLLQTAQAYIDMIKNESLAFGQTIDNKLATEVGDKRNRADSLLKQNDEIEKQIASMNEKKARNVETANALIAEVSEQESTFVAKKSGFEIAANKFISEVQTNVQKITTYL